MYGAGHFGQLGEFCSWREVSEEIDVTALRKYDFEMEISVQGVLCFVTAVEGKK